jgi:hypothetical protein
LIYFIIIHRNKKYFKFRIFGGSMGKDPEIRLKENKKRKTIGDGALSGW